MNKAVFVIIGIVAAAAVVNMFFALSEDQNQIPTPTVTPRVPEQNPQTEEPSVLWAEQPVTFRDSKGYIPEVVTSQNWANGDALQACKVMIDEQAIPGTTNDPDVNWCMEFVQAHMEL